VTAGRTHQLSNALHFLSDWRFAVDAVRLKGLKTSRFEKYRQDMLWTIAIILLILWLLGFSFHVGGGLIHIVLVSVVIVVIIRLVTGRGV
jgi:hypothetical protein